VSLRLSEKSQNSPIFSQTENFDGGFDVKKFGEIEYLTAWELQKQLHADRVNNQIANTLLLLEHPSVYTAGRRTEISEMPIDGTNVINVDRGGKITWHGPGQIVGYLITKLKNPADVVGFVRVIEEALIEVCNEIGIVAQRYCERSGVWIRDERGDRKIAAIGIRVAKGVTTHGFAINLNPDLAVYDRIVPCGIRDAQVTSIAAEKSDAITSGLTKEKLHKMIEKILIPKLKLICS
jgi:lipoyl(octanoyl) transferase